jgi:tripartite-type tricarboxylate transporter receptor subunit TctC
MRELDRRDVLTGVMSTALSLGLSRPKAAWAETYPSRPVKLISPYAPAGATDIIARLIGQWMGEHLKTPFVVENRAGAGANIGTETALRAPPDGYTLLLASTANAVNATLFADLKFNFINDSVPVGSIGSVPNVLVVHPSFPAKTLPEFLDYARKNPGQVSVGLPGNGSPQHLSAALFAHMTKLELLFPQYVGGGPVLKDLIGGHTQASFASSVSSAGHIKQGAIRVLAVTSAKRLPTLPEIPTIGEAVAGYEATNFYGISAPKGVPQAIIQRLNDALNAGLADPAVIERLHTLGITPVPMSPTEFGGLIAAETKKWGDLIRSAGIKSE